VLVTSNLLYSTLLCLCLLFYNLYTCFLLHGNMPLAGNQMLALHICVPEFSWSLATLLHLDLWSYCFRSMIYCSTGTLISFSHTIAHYGFCVSQGFLQCVELKSAHMHSSYIVIYLFMPYVQAFPTFIVDIFSWFLWLRLYKLLIRKVFFLPYIEIEVVSSFLIETVLAYKKSVWFFV